MLHRITLGAAVAAVTFLALPAWADAPADCRNTDLANDARLAACVAATEAAADPLARAEFLDYQGRLLRLRGEVDAAEPLILEARRLAPEDPDPIASLGHILHDRGDFPGAQHLLDQAFAMDPDKPRFVLAAMWNLPDAGDARRCLELAPLAVELAPERATTWAYRGRCLAYVGRDEEAVADLQYAIELGLDEAFVHDGLSVSLFKLGRFPEALDSAHRAVELDPASESSRISLKMALAQAGAPEEAIALYRETQALGITDTLGQANYLAWVLYLTGHSEEALPIIEAWVVAHPDPRPQQASEIDTYAHVLAAVGRTEEAAQAFERTARIEGMLDRANYLWRLQELGFSTADGLGPALRACTATGAACRLQD
jgi:tetratricopeptide (TPR) repeat protein